MEILTKPNGDREVRRYINGTVLVTQDYNQDANGDYQFARSVTRNLLTDHLGSTDVITDVNGLIVQEQSFDAWGARRATTDGVRLDDLTLVSLADVNNEFTTKGFTGHEAVDQVGVIHMNGRIYDARLGRFLQADPQIDGATHTQGFNRYSYGKNNPLNGTDPSGYGFLDSVKQFAGAIVGVALAVIFPPAGPWAAAAFGAISGAVGAAVNGGNILQGALIGGLSAAAFNAVGTAFQGFAGGGDFFGSGLSQGAFFGKVAAHGFVGGVQSVLQGGKFGHGFASAGFTQAFAGKINGLNTKFERVAAAVVGGTTSAISGGKFVNGAITGAFSRAFNDEAHGDQDQQDQSAYDELKNRIESHTGDEAFQITNQELEIIMSHDAEVLAKSTGDSWGEAARFGDGTFYGFAGKQFSITNGWLQGTHVGSDINYYFQGFVAAKYGIPNFGVAASITVYNTLESFGVDFYPKPGDRTIFGVTGRAITVKESIRESRQSINGLKFARYGRGFYERGGY